MKGELLSSLRYGMSRANLKDFVMTKDSRNRYGKEQCPVPGYNSYIYCSILLKMLDHVLLLLCCNLCLNERKLIYDKPNTEKSVIT